MVWMQINSDTAAKIFIAVLKEFMGCNTWTEYIWLIVTKYDKLAPARII